GLQDVARLSHFICRDIVLEENWFKKDSGPLLVFTAEEKYPVPCLPKGPGRYEALDPESGAMVAVTAEYAATLAPQGFMLYRPFPAKKITVKDLFKFGIQGVYKRDIATFVLLALLGTFIGLLIPMMNEQLYDRFIPTGNASGLVQVCFVVLACVVGNMCFTIVKNLAIFRSMNSMEYNVQSATYDRLFNLPESFFRKYDSAELAQRAMGVGSIYKLVSNVAATSLLSAVFSLMYLWRMFKSSKDLAVASIVMLLVVMLLIAFLGWWQTRYEKRRLALDGKISSVMYQLLNGISKIRIAGVENRALYEYLQPYTEAKSIDMRKERLSITAGTVRLAMNTVFSMVLYYIMVKRQANLSIGSFMGFMAAFGAFSAAMLEIVTNFLSVNAVIPIYQRAKPILQTLPELEMDAVLPGTLTGDIEVSNVSFAYDEVSGNVLNNLSFHIRAGEYIGVVGSSGSGKSTLLKLLLGFEKPGTGKVFYDGKDIDSMDKRELRKKFGVVLQDGQLISGSIFENITITTPGTPV
ncbi:MAG: ATP-binding cassette domain-containing protein, partial [Oscillospiraceae bacterium]